MKENHFTILVGMHNIRIVCYEQYSAIYRNGLNCYALDIANITMYKRHFEAL